MTDGTRKIRNFKIMSARMEYKENLYSRAISTKELILENDFVLQVWCLKF